MLVALCGLSAIYAEIMIPESEIRCNRTVPAGTSHVFGNTEQTFSGDAVEQLIVFPRTEVVGRTCHTDTSRPLFICQEFAFFCIFLPGQVQPLFKYVHTDPFFVLVHSSIARNVIID